MAGAGADSHPAGAAGRPWRWPRPAGLLAALVGAAGLALMASSAGAQSYPAPYCQPGQAPRFVLGFAELKEQLGATMGEPLECEHADPQTGDVSQRTSTGMAFYDAVSGTRTFTAGYRHWSLTADGLSYWDGSGSSAADAAVAGGAADLGSAAVPASSYPLNGRFLLVNMHGALFHEDPRDFQENVAYAQWLGTGVIRVFATDSNTFKPWDGRRVGSVIAQEAPVLRAARIKLVVALVNNHQPVPGEAPESAGWLDGYYQLLLPFYTRTWRDSYLSFLRALISTVRDRGAGDVIQAWQIGNELHTPESPTAFVPFVVDVARQIRALDPSTPIYPGTMGANHLQPWNPASPVARWLYCEAPVDAYTLHAYDWVSRERSGDMPIQWDLDTITAEPCPSGRRLPVIVEELGTSRALPGVYTADQEERRLEQEVRQIRFVLGYGIVQGLGVWNGESPRVRDRTFYDRRRGLTSYGPDGEGGGSCYDPRPLASPGVRCRLERLLQALPAPP